jgi:hypothetical protein
MCIHTRLAVDGATGHRFQIRGFTLLFNFLLSSYFFPLHSPPPFFITRPYCDAYDLDDVDALTCGARRACHPHPVSFFLLFLPLSNCDS